MNAVTVDEAIARVDELMPNQYGRKEKTQWLSTLDGQLAREVMAGHEGVAPGALAFDGYTEADGARGLLVPFPYDDLYEHYLMAQIGYLNGEMDRYNNAMVMYNMALTRFTDWFNRTHLPKQAHYARVSLAGRTR